MQIIPKTKDAYSLFHEGIQVLSEIESTGICIDMPYCRRQHTRLGRRIEQQEKKLDEFKEVKEWHKVYGNKFNLDSDPQLSDILFKRMGHEPVKYTAGSMEKDESEWNPSVDQSALESIDLPMVQELILYRRLCKAKDTYLAGIMRETVNSILHPSFNLHTARTFRSCVAKGSLVLAMRDFDKKGVLIEQIKAGDYVYCFDNNLYPAIRKVLWAGKTGHRKVIRLHWRGGKGKKGYLDVTPEHLIRHISGDYIQAKNLIGDLRGVNENKHAPKIRVLSASRRGDSIYFTNHIKNGSGVLEHHLIYSELIGKLRGNDVVHHKDKNHFNHKINNLEKMTLSAHSKLHVGDTLCSEKARINNVIAIREGWKNGKYTARYGKEHPMYLGLSKFRCLRVLAQMGGKLPKGHKRGGYDFGTFKKYLQMYNICPSAVKLRYDGDGKYISKVRLIELSKHGRTYVMRKLKINFYRLKELYEQYGVNTKRLWGNQFGGFVVSNHCITKIEWLEKEVDVYDIEVEDHHNFIANEICVHNSSSNPNFQNIPTRIDEIKKIIRQAFIPRQGHRFGGLDYVGIEVCISTVYHKDPTMLKYIHNPKSDLHRDTAMDLFQLTEKQVSEQARYIAKSCFVFPQFYGDWWLSCAKSLWDAIDKYKIETADKVPLKEHLRSKGIKGLGTVDVKTQPSRGSFYEWVREVERVFWYDRFPVYTQWKKDWMKMYEKQGYVDMYTGFRCSGIMGRNDVINYPVQGTAFHCLLWSLIKLHRWMKKEGLRSKCIGQIHDEIVMDNHPEEMDLVLIMAKRIMCEDIKKEWQWINVSLGVEAKFADVNKSWYDVKEIDIPILTEKVEF